MAIGIAVLIGSTFVRASESQDQSPAASFLKNHCVKCHGGGDVVEADVSLSSSSNGHWWQDAELLGRVIDVIDLGEMPPDDEPPLDSAVRQTVLEELRTVMRASISVGPNYLRTPMRRMNRFQYNNAVVDLFDLRCVVFTLPERMMREHNDYFRPASGKMADVVTVGSRPLGKSQLIERRLAGVAAFPQDLRAEHGFDNRGDHLSLSPLLMQSFLELGHSVTTSPDFGPDNVGIWQSFFQPPSNTTDMQAEVRERLRLFLRRAFRGTVDAEQLERYVAFVSRRLETGSTFTDAMKSIAAATIASPKFLYFFDTASQGESVSRVDGFELASRLSLFLWGSIPDETLLDLAESGELHTPAVLAGQVDRMLRDDKLKRFCDSFPSQWLQLERIISSVPNREKYPQFYFAKYRESMHMMLEPLLLFETVLVENLPVTQLIDADFTYRSQRLENSYGELATESTVRKSRAGGVGVLTFNRVPVTDRRGGGVITNAAVMTMTSGPDRTKPVTRGAWIASVIFNNPPNPPPANVPALDEQPPAQEAHLTLRERLSMHRERSDCRGCHEQIDPLGFALENYDAVGKWRQEYENGRQVDVAGTLFRKHSFSDIAEFKDAILEEKDRFTLALAGHLLSFGLARELGTSDQLALEKIARATAADEYKMRTLIKQVIASEPFQFKSSSRGDETP